jgi:hypothetical protein
MCKTKVPSYKYIGSNNNGLFFSGEALEENLKWVFCYEVGAALKYVVASKMYVAFNLNYFSANFVQRYNYNPNFPTPGPATASGKRAYAITGTNTMVGAGINF